MAPPMRSLLAVAPLVLLFSSATARAANSDTTPAFAAATALNLVGFLAGGTLLGTSHGDSAQNDAGWLTIESGFVLAPLAAHGFVGEWARGAVFASVPAGTLGATAVVFANDPRGVEHGSLPEQRWMWAFFGVGLFASAAGVVDAMFAPSRQAAIALTPSVAGGSVGLAIRGLL